MEEQTIDVFIAAAMFVTLILVMACCMVAGYIKGKHKGEGKK